MGMSMEQQNNENKKDYSMAWLHTGHACGQSFSILIHTTQTVDAIAHGQETKQLCLIYEIALANIEMDRSQTWYIYRPS